MAVKQQIMDHEQEVEEINASGLELKTVSRKIKNALKSKQSVTITNGEHLDGIASGLRTGKIVIKGSAGKYAGTLNSGARLTIQADVGDYVGDNMTSGEIMVEGNAGYCAAPYCYGGTVVISGSAGDFTGTMNKGATIIVGKDVGNDVGTYMLAGNLILLGNAGESLGNFLIAGCIFIKGKWQSLGHNTKIDELTSEDIDFLTQALSSHNMNAKLGDFKKLVPETDSPFYSSKKSKK
ncbi:MAG: GltB/FmdC/FwdC-like GXGXG domain-containing protein [Candidatus Hodarchaeales archaeon]|jgi:glutamate synthase domain-containing protein 3